MGASRKGRAVSRVDGWLKSVAIDHLVGGFDGSDGRSDDVPGIGLAARHQHGGLGLRGLRQLDLDATRLRGIDG